MHLDLQPSELPFTSIDDDEFLNLFTHDNLFFQCNTSFNVLDLLEDKYNSDLDVNHSSVFSKYQNIPKSDYVYLDSLFSLGTNTNNTTLLSMNIRSIPTNFQSLT